MSQNPFTTNLTTIVQGILPLIGSSNYNNTPTGCLISNTTETPQGVNNGITITSLIILISGVLGNLVVVTFLYRWKQLSLYEHLLLNLAVVDVMGCVVLPANVISSFSCIFQPYTF